MEQSHSPCCCWLRLLRPNSSLWGGCYGSSEFGLGRPHIQLTKAGCLTFGGAACGELPGWRPVGFMRDVPFGCYGCLGNLCARGVCLGYRKPLLFFKIEIRSRICFFFLADSGTFPMWLLSAVRRVEALAGTGELLPAVLKMNYEDANSSFGSTVWQITDAGHWRTRSRLFSAAVSLGISKRERHAVWCFHVTLQQVTLLECSSAAVPPK